MYPPKITDELVLATVQQLTVGSQLPSGAHLRAALKARFGVRGGVSRIYRLLARAREEGRAPPNPIAASSDAETDAIEALRDRAERAEQREDAHQVRWAKEIDELRLQVSLLEPLAQQTRAALQTQELLRAQLRAAQSRIAALEAQWLANQDRAER